MVAIGIEDLVRWAWLEELPKVPPVRAFRAPASLGYTNSWAATVGLSHQRSAGYLNHFGAVFDPNYEGEPHPDALVVADAVAGLDEMVVVESDLADFFGAWGDFGQLGEKALHGAWDLVRCEISRADGVISVLRGLASSIVVRVAITGAWPMWAGEAPVVVPATGPNGHPKWARLVDTVVEWDEAGTPVRTIKCEVDGMNRRSRRPFPGAYLLTELAPDPTKTLAERIRWSMLHLWFSHLAISLDGVGDRRVLPPSAPAMPWAG